jgi:hypothetical protein
MNCGALDRSRQDASSAHFTCAERARLRGEVCGAAPPSRICCWLDAPRCFGAPRGVRRARIFCTCARSPCQRASNAPPHMSRSLKHTSRHMLAGVLRDSSLRGVSRRRRARCKRPAASLSGALESWRRDLSKPRKTFAPSCVRVRLLAPRASPGLAVPLGRKRSHRLAPLARANDSYSAAVLG